MMLLDQMQEEDVEVCVMHSGVGVGRRVRVEAVWGWRWMGDGEMWGGVGVEGGCVGGEGVRSRWEWGGCGGGG